MLLQVTSALIPTNVFLKERTAVGTNIDQYIAPVAAVMINTRASDVEEDMKVMIDNSAAADPVIFPAKIWDKEVQALDKKHDQKRLTCRNVKTVGAMPLTLLRLFYCLFGVS